METTYSVLGMTCENCERHVSEEVSLLPGVISVRADADSGTLVVASDAVIAEDSLRSAVEEAGYTLAHD